MKRHLWAPRVQIISKFLLHNLCKFINLEKLKNLHYPIISFVNLNKKMQNLVSFGIKLARSDINILEEVLAERMHRSVTLLEIKLVDQHLIGTFTNAIFPLILNRHPKWDFIRSPREVWHSAPLLGLSEITKKKLRSIIYYKQLKILKGMLKDQFTLTKQHGWN